MSVMLRACPKPLRDRPGIEFSASCATVSCRGDSPSLREVQQHFGFRAVETVRAHLTALVEEGRLVKEPGRARGYRLPKRQPKRQPKRLSAPVPDWSSGRLQPVPLLGEVAAGGFEEAIENPEGNLPVEIPDSRDLSDYFALRVRGYSICQEVRRAAQVSCESGRGYDGSRG